MKIGLDLVNLVQFSKKLEDVDLAVLFSESELKEKSVEHLAGLFAAKEAFFKALGGKENWREVWIDKDQNGKPKINSSLLGSNEQTELSITHDGDYAAAIVLIF